MADSDDSSVSSSSSSSDSVLIPMPLDQRRRKKLRAQLQEDQRRQRERQEGVSSRRSDADSDRVKTEHICVVCEHEGDELVVCAGPCISAFHVACLPSDSGPAGAKNDAWLCPSCKSKSHACFHCKQKGVEMLPEETATAASADPSKRPVRKCRALSCGKFYHQDCITQFPLARIAIAGTHFICPLHTCAGCNQSGAQQEAISSKLIICPKHADEPKETVVVEKKETITNIAVPERAPVSESGSVRMQEVENEDEVMSEASAVSAGSARKREKREKREKRDKKKKKKKKKKDKHKEKRESLASQADDDQDSSRNDGSSGKRKRSKRESSVEAGDRAGIEHADKGGPATPSASRTELGARALVTPLLPTSGYTDGGASRSPTSSFALFESPATANKRIQERLVEALGQSDDDEDSDDTGASPSLKRKRSNNHITGSGMRNTSHGAVKSEHLTQDLSPTLKQDVTKGSPEPSASSSSSAHVLERHGSHSEMDETANNRRVEHQSEQHQSFDSTLKLEIPRSPSASVLIPSSIPSATLELKHVPSDDDEEEDEEGGDKSIGFSSDATPRAIGSAREADMLSTGTPKGGKSGGNQGKKKKKSKSKRALKREISEEDEDNSEAKWVQCDSCKKWRTVPKDFNLDAMPNHWYCNMNTWDVRYASCSVAEEVLKLNPSPDKKSKNRVKRSKSFTVTMTSDGGSSSGTGALKRTTGSSKGSSSDIALLEEKEKRSSKTKDKSSKKRKMTKQLKEKYREVNIPEEADQEPLPLPPHPGSQWHKGGHKQRSKRGKLSYSDLLYGSTGQLRKAYTQESSTLSFEYEGITYHRDGQYKHSSMYVSPAAMAAAATMAGWGGSDRVIRETSCSNINETIASTNEDGAFKPQDLTVVSVPQANIDRVAALVLDSMDLRRRRSISELLEVVNCTQRTAEAEPCGLVSLAVVTAAVGQLEHRGLVEKVTELSDEDEDESSQKRRKTELPLTFGAFSLPAHYRKVPTRPLKASKCWKFGTNVVALSPLKDS
ncbi:nuclear receptor binding SET domain protein 1 [Phytophthora boehmeriae]|uniref:Nuclear receptor binding SET domain protein 1 n=1 Tax=Phytophthora boehmeriae TaxID=109152 RepID=A0A8T1X3N7_9STRA|nr:nuclear receptor binding SET domain protein 1 [Phytophthora boehmeriae]